MTGQEPALQPVPHPIPEALDILIPELKKQGYKFVTANELFARKKVTPKARDGQMRVYAE